MSQDSETPKVSLKLKHSRIDNIEVFMNVKPTITGTVQRKSVPKDIQDKFQNPWKSLQLADAQ